MAHKRFLAPAVLFLSFSAGIACYPEDGEPPKALLETADRRLYHRKGMNGRLPAWS